MPTVIYRLPTGDERSVEVPIGTSVMRGAFLHNIHGIDAMCGGCCSCATCHVYVDPGFAEALPPPSDDESDMLTGVAAEQRPSSRLSCQLVVTDTLRGLVVAIPERQS